MKKFVIGLLFGAILSTSIATYGSNSLSATLSPSRIIFHFNNAVVEVDGSEKGILYYKDRSYVPIRVFSETMGATVDYQEASEKSNMKNLIDVYLQ